MVLSRYANPNIRRWIYALGEVAGVTMFGASVGTFFKVPEMSAYFFMLLGIGSFAICTCLKRIDKGDG